MIIPSSSFGVVASSRPRVAAQTGFGAGDLAFDDIAAGLGVDVYGNIVTATKSGTIYVSTTTSVESEHFARFNINGVMQTSFTPPPGGTAIVGGGETGSFNITAGDTMQWYAQRSGAPVGPDSFTVTIRNANSSGTIIDTFTVFNGL